MSGRRKKSLGRDPFADDAPRADGEGAVRRLIRGAGAAGRAREVEVTVRLTPATLKHLERVREALAARGRTDVTRDDLIRIAITLLSADDVT